MCNLNLIELKRRHCEWVMRRHGLKPNLVELDNGAIMHCWAPAENEMKQPIVVLIHGFGVEGHLAWEAQVKALSKNFKLYIPDLLFFGHSKPPIRSKHDNVDDRSEFFQASCIYEMLKKLMRECNMHRTMPLANGHPYQSMPVNKESPLQSKSTIPTCEKCSHGTTSIPIDYQAAPQMKSVVPLASILTNHEDTTQSKPLDVPIHVVGHSYGGIVAYRMAHMYPNFVSSLVIVSSGIMMAPRDTKALMDSTSCDTINKLLVPPTPIHLKKFISTVFSEYRWLLSCAPNFVYRYIHQTMFQDLEGKEELVNAIVTGKEKSPPIPIVEQDVFIIWGDKDEIFDISLGHQLKKFLGDKAKLAIIKGVGHVPQFVKPMEFNSLLTSHLERFGTKYKHRLAQIII